MTQSPKQSKFSSFFLAMLVLLAVLAFCWFGMMGQNRTAKQTHAPTSDDTPVYQPVQYKVEQWQTTPKQSLDLKGVMAKLGATATSEQTLDFYGKPATLYRFGAKHEPSFYAVQSDGLLEVVWHYAAAKENDAQKQASMKYAQTVYAMMGAYAGADGESLVKNMLQQPNQSHANPAFGVVMARCAGYQCRIVLQS